MKANVCALAKKGMARGKVLIISGCLMSFIVVLVAAMGLLYIEMVNEVLNLYPKVIANSLFFGVAKLLSAGAFLGPNLVMLGLLYRDSSAPLIPTVS